MANQSVIPNPQSVPATPAPAPGQMSVAPTQNQSVIQTAAPAATTDQSLMSPAPVADQMSVAPTMSPAPNMSTVPNQSVVPPDTGSTSSTPTSGGATSTPSTGVPEGARLLGPTEYQSLVSQFRADPSTFDKYFYQSGQDIYLRADAFDNAATSGTSTKDTNIDVSAGSSTSLPSSTGTSSAVTTALSTAAAKTAEITGLVNGYRTQAQNLDAAATDKLNAAIQDARDGIVETSNFSYQQYLKDLQSAEDLAGKEKALTDIQGRIADTNTGLQQALLNVGNLPIALSFIRGQQARLQTQAAATIAGLSAQADIIQGQLDRANTRIKQFFDATSLDQTAKMQKFTALLDFAEKDLVKLEDKEKESVQFQIDTLKDVMAQQQKDRDSILSMMASNPAAYAKANIDLNDPIETNLKKFAVAAGEATADQSTKDIVTSYIQSYPDAGILQTDSLQTAQIKLKTSKIYQNSVAVRSSGGGGGGSASDGNFPKGFIAAADKAKAELRQGIPWPEVWPSLKAQFPSVDNDSIDAILGGSAKDPNNPTGWAEPGHYQKWKQSIVGGGDMRYDDRNIPSDTRDKVITNINEALSGQGTLAEVINLWPQVDAAYITSLYKAVEASQ